MTEVIKVTDVERIISKLEMQAGLFKTWAYDLMKKYDVHEADSEGWKDATATRDKALEICRLLEELKSELKGL